MSIRKIAVQEIALHNRPDDLWIVVEGTVYDMTDFAPKHPGGAEIVYRFAGRDASRPYGHVHAPSLIRKHLDPSLHLGIVDPESVTPQWRTDANSADTEDDKGDETARPPLDEIVNLTDFEKAAGAALPAQSWAYISTGSNDNITRDANKEALQRILLRPRILLPVRDVFTGTSLFGGACPLSLPVLVSPTGTTRTGGNGGEVAISQGVAGSGVIQVISTVASYPYEEILSQLPNDGYAFFQLYVDSDRPRAARVLRDLLTGPQGHKVRAIFVTVDLPVISKREDDERVRNRARKAMMAATSFEVPEGGIARVNGGFVDANLKWDDLEWIRSVIDGATATVHRPSLPLVVKGIQRADDAREALRRGCQGIVLSNHGGRAVDTAPPSILTLLELHQHCPEVFGRMEIFVDGGFRRGTDVVKALCLGASAVGIGRPFVCSVGYGKEGVQHAVKIIREEVEVAMRLCGMTDLMRDVHPDFVNTGDVDHLVAKEHHPYAKKPHLVSRL